ncbi:MAG TPA: UDP-3-O-(3-hydroxymyristoyl)glucosamine N-acyltransferase [Candidatus Acidoferrales bacterium]|nr:UDP-3-O-(3-hydroxymyristoyl)glucosamine N-acyltransferase [Candidatus Acidoferrales bacterium]
MRRTALDLAEYLQAELHGNPSLWLSGVAGPEDAGPEDLIYLDALKHLPRAQTSAAKCAVVREGVLLEGKTLLIVKDPKLAFAKAAAWLLDTAPIATGMHPTAWIDASAKLSSGVSVGAYAVIESGAKISAGVEIGAFCYIGKDVIIGESCRLFPRVTLYSVAQLGRRVVVHSGAVIGGDGFGYVFGEGKQWKFPQVGRVEIGDDVEIGNNSTIACGSLGTTQIGRGVKIDNLVHIAHNVRIGEHTVIAAQTGVSGSSKIGRHVAVGGQVGIADHCTIEDDAVLGAQAGIPTGKTIRAKEIVWGTPARPLKRFKQQYACFSRLPELAERVRRLEEKAR